jgi:hypothetical protein
VYFAAFLEPIRRSAFIRRIKAPPVREIIDAVRRAARFHSPKLGYPLLCLLLTFATEAAARDYGQYRDVDPEVRQWIQGLKDKTGKGCCDTADGHPAEYEWDIAGNRYKVRIEGEWYVVPTEAVIDGPNKLGYATVWYWWSWELDGNKIHHIRCFLPGPNG